MKKSLVLLAVLLSGCASIQKLPDAEPITVAEPAYELKPNPNLLELDMTQAYETAANRTANKMLDDTADIYETHPHLRVYVHKTEKANPTLPDGFYTARRTIKEVIGQSDTYTVVENASDADIHLVNTVHEFNVDGQPGIVFRIDLYNIHGQHVRGWSSVIKQMSEDQSWW